MTLRRGLSSMPMRSLSPLRALPRCLPLLPATTTTADTTQRPCPTRPWRLRSLVTHADAGMLLVYVVVAAADVVVLLLLMMMLLLLWSLLLMVMLSMLLMSLLSMMMLSLLMMMMWL
jgi:hypothetical protein